jgi:hypothetical protein
MVLRFTRRGETAMCTGCSATITVPEDAREIEVSEADYLQSRGIEDPGGPEPSDLEFQGHRSPGDPMDARRMHPIVGIWFEPAETILEVVSVNPAKYFVLLSGMWGAGRYVNFLITGRGGYTDVPSVWLLVLYNLALGALFGIAMLEATSYVYAFVGRKLGGRGTRAATRAALAWSGLPQVVTLAVGIAILLIADGPASALAGGMPISTSLSRDARGLFSTVGGIFGLWSLILNVRTLAAVMGFGTVRALITGLVGGAFILICILIQVILWVALTG